MSVLVGLLDSGVAPELTGSVRDSCCLFDAGADALDDGINHATPLSRILLQQAPAAELLVARIFDRRPVTTAATVAAGIDWLVECGAQLINMSFGLREERSVLRQACEAAARRGVLLVASAPARGEPVYPAAYAQVISVTGDIRCAPGQVSHLGSVRAQFGACPYWSREDQQQRLAGGASFAVPYVVGRLARLLTQIEGKDSGQMLSQFAETCEFQGEEQRPDP